jgi:hypothetical protein
MAIVKALLFSLALAPDVLMPRPLELSAASGDPVELERLVTRLGPARTLQLVRSAIRSGQHRAAAAGLRGLGLAGSQHPQLAAQAFVPLIELLAQTAEEKLQNAAGETLIRLAGTLGHDTSCDEPDELGCGGELPMAPYYLTQLAGRAALPWFVRAQLMQALALLPVSQWRAEAQRVVTILRGAVGPGPEHAALRQAALGALAVLAQHGDDRWLVAMALDPAEPLLAAAAAAELCLPGLVPRRPQRPVAANAGAQAPPASLPPAVVERVRSLAGPEQPFAVRLQVEGCLRLLGTPQDRALLQAIPPPWKKKK